MQMRTQKKATGRSRGQPPPTEVLGIPLRLQSIIGELEQQHGKLTQDKIAKGAGVSQSVISKMRKAKTVKGVTAAAVVRVAKALGVEPGWLLTGYGPKLSLHSRSGGGAALRLDEAELPLLPAPSPADDLPPKPPGRRKKGT